MSDPSSEISAFLDTWTGAECKGDHEKPAVRATLVLSRSSDEWQLVHDHISLIAGKSGCTGPEDRSQHPGVGRPRKR